MLMHSEKLEGLERSLWELRKAAEGAGLPLPPPLKLPPLPDLSGGCDLNLLAERIGTEALTALRAQLGAPDLRALLTGGLEAEKGKLLGYLDLLDRRKSDTLGQVNELLGDQGALGQGRELLAGLRGALGTTDPLTGPVLGAVAEACPVVGGLLEYAESTIGTLDSQLEGVQSTLESLTSRLAAASNVRSLAEQALGELEAHITRQGELFRLLDEIGG